MAYNSTSRRTKRWSRDLLARRVAQAWLFLMAFIALWTCPHSKVEESFNLQATHDLIYHGLTPAVLQSTSPFWYNETTAKAPLPPLEYDHLSYPGVVPRTFVGPLLLSWAIQLIRIPFLWTQLDILDYPLWIQFLARLLVLIATVQSWWGLARAVDHKVASQAYSQIPYSAAGTYLLAVTACQFHMPFYASRVLPNIFALLLTLNALQAWLLDDATKTAVLLVVATGFFRCDVLLLLFTVGLSLLITKRLSVLKAIQIGTATGMIGLIVTVPLDSLLWQRWVWPEGEVFYYNTILGKSSDWGTSPWYWYATSALPKLLLAMIVWVPCAFLAVPETVVAWWESKRQTTLASSTKSSSKSSKSSQQSSSFLSQLMDTTWLEYLLPAIGYVALYSCLGHKEVRFLFPVMPFFNLAAAVGMTRVHKLVFVPSQKDKKVSPLARLGLLVVVGTMTLSFVASIAFFAVSQRNYPGGDALLRLEQHLQKQQIEDRLVPNDPEVRVYIDVAAAMSGISLFGQRHAATVATTSSNNKQQPALEWQFTKAGFEDEHAMKADFYEYSASFTHIIAEASNSNSEGGPKISTNAFTLVDVIPGQPRWDLKSGSIVTQDYLYLWERIGYWQGIRN